MNKRVLLVEKRLHPILISTESLDALERYTNREWALERLVMNKVNINVNATYLWIGEAVLVAQVYVIDLNLNVVDNFFD